MTTRPFRMLSRAIAGAIFLTIIGLTAAAARQAAPAGTAKTGRTLYMKIGCYQCHGNEGQGGAAGPRIGPAPMLAFRAFATYLRAPRGEMPPYTAKVVSEQDLADIYAYLAGLPSPGAVDRIPLLNPGP